jgi:hypothetical protein
MATLSTEPRIAPRRASARGGSAHAPWLRWPLVALIGLLTVSGFYGGWSFITDTTGAGLQAKLSWLERTPVDDFLLPGLFLFGVYGVGGLLLIVGLIRRGSPGPLRRLDGWIGFHWSWAGAIVFGGVLVLWIAYELLVMPEQIWIQPALLVVGVLIATIPLLPSMRRWYAVGQLGTVTERG